MKFMRRQFQVGPTRHHLEHRPGGWVVVATWWEISRRLDEEERQEVVSGPMARREAQVSLKEFRGQVKAAEERRRKRAKEIACMPN